MAHGLIVALGLALASAQPPSDQVPANPAPPGTPETRYCLRVDPLIGSKIPTIECLTRYEWSMLEIDVDQEWAENGVRVIA